MKTLDTIAGHTYVVSSPNGGTVTSADGLVKEDVEAGKQKVVFGTGAPLQLDDDAGKIMATFKLAPAKLMALGLLGGGVQTLPAGCIPVEFLTFTQKCYIDTDYLPQRGYSAKMTLLSPDLPKTSQIFLFGGIAAGRFNIVALHGGWEKFTYYTEVYMTMHRATVKGWWFESNKKYEFTINDIANKKKNVPNKSIVFNAQDVAYDTDHTSYNGEFAETFKIGGVNATWGHVSTVRHFAWTFSNPSGEVELELIPALDTQRGEACLCDVKRHKVYYKGANLAGRVVPGFTLAQARNLSKLPATGGSLTVSLPEGYESDSGVVAALETARSNGWTLTIQTYTPETATAGASTFALRRIWVRRIWVRRTQDEDGTYVDAAGSRWQVDWCVDMLTPDSSTPDAHGYELFRSVDAAVAYWELEPWVDPNADELLTNSTTND